MRNSLFALSLLVATTNLHAFELAGASINESFNSVQAKAPFLADGKNRLYLSNENILIKIKGTEQNRVKQIKVAHAILDKDFHTVLSEYKSLYPLNECLKESKLSLKSIREKGYGKVICTLTDKDSALKLNIASYAGQVTVKATLTSPK